MEKIKRGHIDIQSNNMPRHICSGGIKGGMGAFAPQSEALPPTCPPVRRKKWPKSAIFGNILDFCPLRNVFFPLDAPHKKIFWCRHCIYVD